MRRKVAWTRRGGYKSYGKTALRQGINITGIDEYLKKIEDVGKNVDEVVMYAINESAGIIKEDMVKGAERHKDTGEVVNAIEATPAEKDGNVISSKIGIDLKKYPEAKHAVFQEYGGNSDGFPDPFIRPAFDDNRRNIKTLQKRILKRAGIPIDK